MKYKWMTFKNEGKEMRFREATVEEVEGGVKVDGMYITRKKE